MNKIVRWYNQNKRIIIFAILIIIAVISLVQILDKYYKNKAKDESSSANSSTTTYNTNNYSIITKENINETTSEKSADLIKDFFDYCNNGDIEEAYNMLSEECKNELYTTVNVFKEKYYNLIFTEKRSYDSILWINTNTRNTYRVEIMSDLLATGKKDSMPIEEYYTIINEDGKYKLNINRFIGKEEINVTKNQSDINITIISKKMYIDYETYEVRVENKSGSKLIFNTKEDAKSIYLQDENELKSIAFLNEIADNELEIPVGGIRTLKIKFNRGYKPKIDILKIVFQDININGQKETLEVEI